MLLLSAALMLLPAATHPPDAVDRFVRKRLGTSSYKRASTDLNGDGRPETLVYVTDPDYCGSGGCLLLIVTRRANSLRVVMRTPITRPPIRLLPTSTKGWRDIGVKVVGGGIMTAYTARLRFDGRRYPGNSTMAPAIRMPKPSGAILIRD